MNRDDIIRMAREAECEETWGMDAFRFTIEQLDRFAELVAAAEREACAKVCEEDICNCCWTEEAQAAAECFAAAIRARGNT